VYVFVFIGTNETPSFTPLFHDNVIPPGAEPVSVMLSPSQILVSIPASTVNGVAEVIVTGEDEDVQPNTVTETV
jgi:hypothetical protein